jgi:hypothetical protein
VKYASNEVTVELPNLPKAVIKIGDEEYDFDLVKKVDEKVLAEIPQKFRLGDCCSLALIEGAVKCYFAPTAQVNVELIGKKLYVIVKDGCQYYAGVKDVTVLDPVRLVVKDEKGQEFHGRAPRCWEEIHDRGDQWGFLMATFWWFHSAPVKW